MESLIELTIEVLSGKKILSEPEKEQLKAIQSGFEDNLKLTEIIKKQEEIKKQLDLKLINYGRLGI